MCPMRNGRWLRLLTLLPEDAGQREHPLREVFNGLRHLVR